MLKKSLYLLLIGLFLGLVTSGCVIKDDDPCDGVSCDGHGACEEWEGQAVCSCDTGYETSEDGLHCVLAGSIISLTWSFPDASNCTGALITDVHVEMYEGTSLLTDNTIDCGFGGVDIEDVADGSYTIDLTAMTTSGERHYYASVDVSVVGQDVDLGDIVLDPIGFILLYWEFPGGGTCTTVGVDDVIVTVAQAGTTIHDSGALDCADGGYSVGDFYLATDYDLTIECFCVNDPRIIGYKYEATMQINNKGENEYPPLEMVMQSTGCP